MTPAWTPSPDCKAAAAQWERLAYFYLLPYLSKTLYLRYFEGGLSATPVVRGLREMWWNGAILRSSW